MARRCSPKCQGGLQAQVLMQIWQAGCRHTLALAQKWAAGLEVSSPGMLVHVGLPSPQLLSS